MQDQTKDHPLTLVYYNFRGLAQNIRQILYYLDVPFTEIFLQQGHELTSLPILKPLEVAGQVQLPCLLDGKLVIPDFFNIIRYICGKAKRQDLLGETLEEKAIIREMFYLFILKKKKCIKLLFKFGEQVAAMPTKMQEIRKGAMQYFHKQSDSLISTLRLRLRHPNQRYIFSHLTVLDFLFYEECFYQVSLFGNLEQKNCRLFETLNSIFGTDLNSVKDKSVIYLRVMKEFKQSFQKQEFFIKNKEKLESYTVISPSMSNFTQQAFKKVWLGPEHYLNKSKNS